MAMNGDSGLAPENRLENSGFDAEAVQSEWERDWPSSKDNPQQWSIAKKINHSLLATIVALLWYVSAPASQDVRNS